MKMKTDRTIKLEKIGPLGATVRANRVDVYGKHGATLTRKNLRDILRAMRQIRLAEAREAAP